MSDLTFRLEKDSAVSDEACLSPGNPQQVIRCNSLSFLATLRELRGFKQLEVTSLWAINNMTSEQLEIIEYGTVDK